MDLKHIEAPIYWAPTKKLGGGWIAFKDSPQQPPPPDPQATSQAQTQSNVATANANAQLNRVNQSTPWGSLTYTKTPGEKTFDQASYDKAMQNYTDQLSKLQSSSQALAEVPEDYHGTEAEWRATHSSQPDLTSNLVAPNRNDFMTLAGPDTWSSQITLDPTQQKLLDTQNQISLGLGNLGTQQLGTVGNTLSQPLNFNGAPSQVTGVQSGPLKNNVNYGNIQNDVDMSGVPSLIGGDKLADDLNTTRDALYKTQTGYLDPQWQNDQHDLENKLAQQGVMQNSDAWNRAIDDFSRNKTFAYNQAQQSAITGAGAEQSRLFNIGLASNQNAYSQASNNATFHNTAQNQGFTQGLANAQLWNSAQGQQFDQGVTNANLQNQGRTQNINEIMALRQQPLNELNALRTGSQVTSPTFGNVPTANQANTDFMSPINTAYQGAIAGTNAQIASNNANTGAAASVGSSALMAYAAYAL